MQSHIVLPFVHLISIYLSFAKMSKSLNSLTLPLFFQTIKSLKEISTYLAEASLDLSNSKQFQKMSVCLKCFNADCVYVSIHLSLYCKIFLIYFMSILCTYLQFGNTSNGQFSGSNLNSFHVIWQPKVHRSNLSLMSDFCGGWNENIQ